MTTPATPTDVRPLACTGRPRCLSRNDDSEEMKRSWVRSRFDALRAAGANERSAAALLAHYAVETGWGRNEHNYALGNIRWTSSVGGPAFYQQGGDDAVPRPYRAFNSLEDGARAVLALASGGRYSTAWQALQVGAPETEWYSRLMVAGWHPYSDSGLETYAGVLPGIRSRLGLAPAPQPSPLPYRSRLGPAQVSPTTEAKNSLPSDGSMMPLLIVAGSVGIAGLVIYLSRRSR